MLVDNRCGSMWENVPFRYCRVGTKGHFLWKKWAEPGAWEIHTQSQKGLSSSLLAPKAPQLYEQVLLVRRGFHSQRKARQEGVGFLARKLQPADWWGFLCWWLSGCIVVSSARLTCSAEACKALCEPALLSSWVGGWAVRAQRGNLQEVGAQPWDY